MSDNRKSIPTGAMPHDDVMDALQAKRKDDHSMHDGTMFAHAFLPKPEIRRGIEAAYNMYLWENGLDPSIVRSYRELETEVIDMALSHLNAPEGAVGNFTSGGTESIILAVLAARNYARATRPGLGQPEMVLPVTAHAAFHKAAHYLDVKAVTIDVDPKTLCADLDKMAAAINDNTVLLVGSASSYAHGTTDPIAELGKLALQHNIRLHVDGCIGGFLLPYFKRLGVNVTPFDFAVDGVTSISMDFHKYALTAKGASSILYRDRALREHAIFAHTGWTGYTILNPTVQSSKTAGPVAAAWAAMHLIGDDGYLEYARGLREATDAVIAAVERIDGMFMLGEPEMCLLAFGSETKSIFSVVDLMKDRGWHIQDQPHNGEIPASIHITIVPDNLARIDDFVKDLEECHAEAKDKPADPLAPFAAMMASGELDLSNPDLNKILPLLGIEGGAIPKKMGAINELIDALPAELVDHLLRQYYNDLG